MDNFALPFLGSAVVGSVVAIAVVVAIVDMFVESVGALAVVVVVASVHCVLTS